MSGAQRMIKMDIESGRKASDFRVRDVVMLTARLAQILAEEVDYLEEMKISKLDDLQKEKIFITNALEAQRKLVERYPEMLSELTIQDKKELADVEEIIGGVLKENNRRLLLAKEVNGKVVQAITDVVKETTQSRTYNIKGYAGAAKFNSLSVTLNKTI
ncbi:MAG: hypothetical protein R3D71_08495 [Rickettsiales bacterium]